MRGWEWDGRRRDRVRGWGWEGRRRKRIKYVEGDSRHRSVCSAGLGGMCLANGENGEQRIVRGKARNWRRRGRERRRRRRRSVMVTWRSWSMCRARGFRGSFPPSLLLLCCLLLTRRRREQPAVLEGGSASGRSPGTGSSLC